MFELNKESKTVWTHEISGKKLLKWLVNKGVLAQAEDERILENLFQQLNINEILSLTAFTAVERIPNVNISGDSFVSLTDIARQKDSIHPGYLIQSWPRNGNVVDYLRLWEISYNPDFLDNECSKLMETIRARNATLTPKVWITTTKAIGLTSRAGKNGGTMAHPEIAEAFRAWLFPEVMLMMVRNIIIKQNHHNTAI